MEPIPIVVEKDVQCPKCKYEFEVHIEGTLKNKLKFNDDVTCHHYLVCPKSCNRCNPFWCPNCEIVRCDTYEGGDHNGGINCSHCD